VRTFHVYSRPGCHLCELLLEGLVPLVRGRGRIEVVNIDLDASTRDKYGTRVPVVELEGRALCEYHLDRAAIEKELGNGRPCEPS
jgi:hypothetical protein